MLGIQSSAMQAADVCTQRYGAFHGHAHPWWLGWHLTAHREAEWASAQVLTRTKLRSCCGAAPNGASKCTRQRRAVPSKDCSNGRPSKHWRPPVCLRSWTTFSIRCLIQTQDVFEAQGSASTHSPHGPLPGSISSRMRDKKGQERSELR